MCMFLHLPRFPRGCTWVCLQCFQLFSCEPLDLVYAYTMYIIEMYIYIIRYLPRPPRARVGVPAATSLNLVYTSTICI